MKKIIGIVLLILMCIGLISATTIPTGNAATQTDINTAIADGLEYLASIQAPDGHWGGAYYVACTSMAVLAFENAGYYAGDGSIYAANVQSGLEYLFNSAQVTGIGVQPAGDPDTNGNGIGIYFNDPWGQVVYQTPMVLMAIVGSQAQTATATTGPANVIGRTYHDIVTDIIDWIAWAQTDDGSGNRRGGWRYGPNYGDSDNSISQWPVLGLMTAALWGINAPAFVKSELAFWVAADQNLAGTPATNSLYGSFDYQPGAYFNSIAETATGIMQLTYMGVDKNDPRIIAAEGYINRDWTTNSGWRVNLGNFYGMYAVMKAARLATPTPIEFISNYDGTPGVEWYNGAGQYTDLLIANQYSDGHWEQWASPEWVPSELCTAWGELILEFVPVVVTYDLTITVTDPPPLIPVVGAQVTVVGPETRIGFTDINGQVTFYNLQAGSYQITIIASGFISPPPQTVLLVGDVTLTFDLPPEFIHARSASVWTTDSVGGAAKNQFNLGQTVYIYWHPSPPGTVVDIQVVQQSTSAVVFGPALNEPEANIPLSFVPPAPGDYTVLVNGQPISAIAVSTFFVLPESFLGTLMTIMAAFAAFATIGIIKNKNKKQ